MSVGTCTRAVGPVGEANQVCEPGQDAPTSPPTATPLSAVTGELIRANGRRSLWPEPCAGAQA
jgi:hypothetical protein